MTKKQIIEVTNNAATYIQSVIKNGKKDNPDLCALRISTEKGGCSGFEYKFDYASQKHPFDEEVHAHGATIYIDPAATLQILGSTMDYEEDVFSSGLIFKNPNETAKCGCGKSVQFTINHQESE
tara:strand:+ start:121 stop:492 length:372 start_codon:yes stop_codon:yes gene_type:complete